MNTWEVYSNYTRIFFLTEGILKNIFFFCYCNVAVISILIDLCYLLINIVLLPNLCCSWRLWVSLWVFNLGRNWYQFWDGFHGLISEWPWGTWSIDCLSLEPQASSNPLDSVATQQKKRKINKEPSLSWNPSLYHDICLPCYPQQVVFKFISPCCC